MLHAPIVLDLQLESSACYAMACAQHNDSTLTKNKLAEWDASMNQTVFLATTSAFSSLTSLSQIWRAGVHLREERLFHDLITQTLLRSLQYGIVVMGIVDVFVYVHNCHRQNMDNPGDI